MEISYRVLLLDRAVVDPLAFGDQFAPEFLVSEVVTAASPHEAISIQMEHSFDICFIGEGVALSELKGFFDDVKQLGRDGSCVFVQLRNEVPATLDRSGLKAVGFATIIARTIGPHDRQVMSTALQAILKRKNEQVRIADVGDAMQLLLREVDRVARERKRGRTRPFNMISFDFMENQADVSEAVATGYFEALANAASEAKPSAHSKVEIPEAVLRRNLPLLERGVYRGTSSRVWDRLLKMYGK